MLDFGSESGDDQGLMAGMPMARGFRAWCWEDGGVEWLEAAIAEGKSLRLMAGELGCTKGWLGLQISRDEALYGRIKLAREAAAEVLVGDALDIADSATALDHNARRLQMDARKWLAAKWAPKVYNERMTTAGTVVNVNLATLHLEALRELHNVPTAALPAAVEVIEADLEPETPDWL